MAPHRTKHQVAHTALVEAAGSQFRVHDLHDVSGLGEIRPRFGVLAHGAEIVRIQIVADGPEPRIAVDTQLSLDVVFDDADSVVDNESVPRVLDELKDHTRDVVAAFAPAFE